MSRERRGGGKQGAARPPARPAARPDGRSRGPRPPWPWAPFALGLVILLAVVAALAWRRFGRGGEAFDAIAALSPQQAEAIGLEHERAHRLLEALPYLRRGTQGNGAALWETHCSLAVTLYKVSIRSVNRAGIEQALARSSYERMQLVRECEAEFLRARALAPAGPARATVETDFAEFLWGWGRVWEAFVLFRQAQFDSPADPKLAARADQFQLMLEHPERFATTEEVMRMEDGAKR